MDGYLAEKPLAEFFFISYLFILLVFSLESHQVVLGPSEVQTAEPCHFFSRLYDNVNVLDEKQILAAF